MSESSSREPLPIELSVEAQLKEVEDGMNDLKTICETLENEIGEIELALSVDIFLEKDVRVKLEERINKIFLLYEETKDAHARLDKKAIELHEKAISFFERQSSTDS